MKSGTTFIQGNEAIAQGALYAGLQFFAGYPITPSTEIAEILSEKLPKLGQKFVQMEDEISSMCAVIGASLTGLKVMTATSGPGFSLKQEAIGYAVMAEVPSVVVNVQRGGPSTGLPTGVAQGDVMLKTGMRLMNEKGKQLTVVKSMELEKKSVNEVKAG